MKETPKPFREWQLDHARRTDPERYLRVSYRWTMRSMDEATVEFKRLAYAITKVSDVIKTMNEVFKK